MDDQDDIFDEERQPLNAMVTENLKNVIISRLYKDVEKRTKGRLGGGEDPTKKEASPDQKQYFAASGPIIGALSSGMCAGFSAILLPHLYSEATDIAITKQEGSWIASMLALPLAIGCFFSGYLMDKMGRKIGMLLSCVPFSVGWLILAVASNVPELYVGRFVTGFSMGLMSPMCQVYIAETSAPQHRGILLSGAPLSVALGILLAHVFGTFLHWRVAAGLCGLPPVICIALLIFAKESPSWLLARGRTEEGERSFRWFRGHSEEATNELNNLLSKQPVPTVDKTQTKTDAEHPRQFTLFFEASFFKPFLVLNFFFFVQQFSGVNAIAFYSVSILREVLTDVDEYMATIGIDVVRFVVSVIAILLLKRFGRKTLSVVSAAGTAVSLFVLAAYLGFYTASEEEVEGFDYDSILKYVPLIALISFISFVSIGVVPIPWVLTGELFSKQMRGIGSGATSCFGFLCYFLVVKTTPDLFEGLGTGGTFGLFGVITVVGSIVLTLYLPETKDRTLEEIEAFYNKGKKDVEDPMEPEVISIRF